MEKNKIDILPVIENKLFIGIIQKKQLVQYELNQNQASKNMLSNYERVIGNYHSNNNRTMIFIAAIHGNENSGVIALQRFFKEINQSNTNIEGSVIGLIGNLAALKRNMRHIDDDLNRMWSEKEMKSTRKDKTSEKNEFRILNGLIQKLYL